MRGAGGFIGREVPKYLALRVGQRAWQWNIQHEGYRPQRGYGIAGTRKARVPCEGLVEHLYRGWQCRPARVSGLHGRRLHIEVVSLDIAGRWFVEDLGGRTAVQRQAQGGHDCARQLVLQLEHIPELAIKNSPTRGENRCSRRSAAR